MNYPTSCLRLIYTLRYLINVLWLFYFIFLKNNITSDDLLIFYYHLPSQRTVHFIVFFVFLDIRLGRTTCFSPLSQEWAAQSGDGLTPHIFLSATLPHSSNKPLPRPPSPDLIWMIKSFFFSTNFVPPLLLSGSHRTPSPIDRHIEEITLIAGITSPHVGWLHTGGGGVREHVVHDVQVYVEGGGRRKTKSGIVYALLKHKRPTTSIMSHCQWGCN